MKTVKSVLIIVLLSLSGFAYSQSGWFMTHDSIAGYWINSISFPSVNTGYASAHFQYHGSGILYKTTNGGSQWQTTFFSPISVENVFFINENTGFFTGDNTTTSIIYKTTNGGVNWVKKDSVYSIFLLKFYDSNTGMALGKYGSSLKTTNAGENWFRLPNSTWGEPSSLICLSADIWLIANNSLYKTTNGGLNWTVMTPAQTGMYASTLSFINSTTGYCSANTGKVYKTTDAGENWTQIANLNFYFSFYGNIDFLNENTGYLCSANIGISLYKTTNGGVNWRPYTTSPLSYFNNINFLNSNIGIASDVEGRLFKTTDGGAIFVSNISNEIPEKFELGQNYPNPFNQSSIIDFKLQMKSNTVLKVFDASGREVQTLVNETLAPGIYRVRFDGSGLSSGLYYYLMTVDGKQTAVRKMVMVK